MQRITYEWVGSATASGSYSFTVPAGITSVIIQPLNGTTRIGQQRTINVVPGTTYTVTVAGTNYQINNANSFGSLFFWTGGERLSISWVE